MNNQHRKITGYRDLQPHEIELMNKIKALGAQIEQVHAEVEDHVKDQFDSCPSPVTEEAAREYTRLVDADPMQWALDAKRDLQVGLMKLVRAVAQPGSF